MRGKLFALKHNGKEIARRRPGNLRDNEIKLLFKPISTTGPPGLPNRLTRTIITMARGREGLILRPYSKKEMIRRREMKA